MIVGKYDCLKYVAVFLLLLLKKEKMWLLKKYDHWKGKK